MPDWNEIIRARLATSSISPEQETEIVEELAQHLEDSYQELLAAGSSTQEAERLCLAELAGNPTFIQDLERIGPRAPVEPTVTRSGQSNFLLDLPRDLRYASRTLLKRPAFTVVVILILALGIGATSAIFTVVNAVLLRPLPYPAPDRLVVFGSASERHRQINSVTAPDYLELRSRCRACEQVAAHIGSQPANLTGGSEPDRVRVAQVSDTCSPPWASLHSLGVHSYRKSWAGPPQVVTSLCLALRQQSSVTSSGKKDLAATRRFSVRLSK